MKLSPLVLQPIVTGLMTDEYIAQAQLQLVSKNESARRKACPNTTLSTTNSAWTVCLFDVELQGQKSETNNLVSQQFLSPLRLQTFVTVEVTDNISVCSSCN